MKKYHWFETFFSFTFDVQLISTLYLYLPKLHHCKIKVKQPNSMTKGICKFIPRVVFVYCYSCALQR